MGEAAGQAKEKMRAYLAEIGRRGGLTSRRELTRSQAKQMVSIREAKRAARKEGKPWPPGYRKRLTMGKTRKEFASVRPAIRKRMGFPAYIRPAF